MKDILEIYKIMRKIILVLILLYIGVVPALAGFSVTLNSPSNGTFTNDNTPDFNFTVIGSENYYNCSLYIDNSEFPYNREKDQELNGICTGDCVHGYKAYDDDWETYAWDNIVSPCGGFNVYTNYSSEEQGRILSYYFKLYLGAYYSSSCPYLQFYNYSSNSWITFWSDCGVSSGKYVTRWINITDPWNFINNSIFRVHIYLRCYDRFYEGKINWHECKNNTYIIYKANNSIFDGLHTWYINCSTDCTSNTFNNSLSKENLTFTGNQNITRYIRLPKNASVTSAYLDVKAYGKATNETCYQETANESTACGGLSSGGYQCSGDWDPNYPCSNVYDGNWSSYGQTIFESDKHGYLYINYTKPLGAVREASYWRTKDLRYTNNWVLPESCWNQQPIQLRVRSSCFFCPDLYGDAYWDCWTGTSWHNFYGVDHQAVYEEAMYWYLGGPLNPYIDTANSGGMHEWNWSGYFTIDNGTQTVNLNATLINNYLSTCTPDSEGYCNVPILFHSDSAGILEVSNIEINYTALIISNSRTITIDTTSPMINWLKLIIDNLGENNLISLIVNAFDLHIDTAKFNTITNSSWSNNQTTLDIDDLLSQSGTIYVNDSATNFDTYILNYTLTNNSYYQNTSFSNNLSEQRIYKNDTLYNYANNNLTYNITHYNKYSGILLTGGTFAGELASNSNINLYSEWSGDWLSETWLPKEQDISRTSNLSKQYLRHCLNVSNTIDINFTNVNWLFDNPISGETLTIYTGTVDIIANFYNDTEYAYGYGDWLYEIDSQYTANLTEAGGNAWIKRDINNTIDINFTNIQNIGREGWTCTKQTINISANQFIENATICNKTNVITKQQSNNTIYNDTVIVDSYVDAYYWVSGSNTDTINYSNVLVQTTLPDWAINTSPYIFSINLNSGGTYNLTVNITGKPAVETGYTFTKTQIGGGEKNIYLGTIEIYDSAVSEKEIWYYIPKSRLLNYEGGVSKTYMVDDRTSGFSVQDTNTSVIIKIPTTFGSSSLEPGTHEIKITYWTAGQLPTGGGGGVPIVTEYLRVSPEIIHLNVTQPGNYTIKLNITWSGPTTTAKFDYSDELIPYIVSPKKFENIELKGNVTTIEIVFCFNETELAQQITALIKKISGKISIKVTHMGAVYLRYIPVDISIYKGVPPPPVTAVCGNGICEPGENWLNCPEDCGGERIIKGLIIFVIACILIIAVAKI